MKSRVIPGVYFRWLLRVSGEIILCLYASSCSSRRGALAADSATPRSLPVIYFFYPETAGRSLEEIDIIFARGYVEKVSYVKMAKIMPRPSGAESGVAVPGTHILHRDGRSGLDERASSCRG